MLEDFFQLIGWIGGAAFAISALPQVVLCVRQKNADGIALLLVVMMLIGSGCMSAFSIWNQITKGGQLPLIFNFTLTFISWFIIFCFKLFKKKETSANSCPSCPE